MVGVNNSFPEHSSATVRNIVTILRTGQHGVSRTRLTTLHIFVFLIICPLIHIFTSFSFTQHSSVTIRNILMILNRIIEQVNTECRVQE